MHLPYTKKQITSHHRATARGCFIREFFSTVIHIITSNKMFNIHNMHLRSCTLALSTIFRNCENKQCLVCVIHLLRYNITNKSLLKQPYFVCVEQENATLCLSMLISYDGI